MSYWLEVQPSGQIRSIATAVPTFSPVPLIVGNTMIEIDHEVDPRRTAWFDGTLVDIGDAPSANHAYDWTARAWADPRGLDWFKAAKWTEIKARRDEIEFGTFTYEGNVFDGDVDAQRRLNVLISVSKSALAVGATFSVTFVLANNSTIELTPVDFVAIEQVKVMQVMGAFATALTLRAQITAATTIAEVQAVQWPA